jgi:hypothetical protein
VEGQAFFTTVAGLSVSLAGFGAVIGWLRDDPSGWDPVNLWRLKTIVRHALVLAFLCLALVPIFTITQDDAMTIRIGSAAVVLLGIAEIWRVRSPDPEVWDAVSWRVYLSSTGALALVSLGNISWASLGVFQVLILVQLTSPAAIFTNFVREIGRNRPGMSPAAGPESNPGPT